jgi:electron transport complex protein RnfA
MTQTSLSAVFVSACLTNNFVLAYFLGICPFLGVSGKVATATRMGLAVTVVMVVTSLCVQLLNGVIEALAVPYLRLISYVVVIAATVQLVEMVTRKASPALFRALGIFLPLITTNCAILALALFQTNRGYGWLEGVVFALGAGAGFTLALFLMAGLREKLDLATVPDVLRGAGLTLMVAGVLSLAFMGFAGLGASL